MNCMNTATLTVLTATVLGAPAFADETADHKVHVSVMDIEDGKTVHSVYDNGKIVVEVDGEQVDATRVVTENGTIFLVDEAGNKNKLMTIPTDGMFELGFDWEGEPSAFWRADSRAIELPEPPPVMIGITMDDVPEALRYHLDLKDKPATMVSSVFEDLPAYQAGLRKYDVILGVDGAESADRKSITERLHASQPGDGLSLSVISEGKNKRLTVQLAAYDAERMQASATGHEWETVIDRQFGGDGKLDLTLRALHGNASEGDGFIVNPEGNVFRVPQRRAIVQFQKENMEQLHKALAEQHVHIETHIEKLHDRLTNEFRVLHEESLENRLAEFEEQLDRLIEHIQRLKDEQESE